jgi:hypothetical protein
MTALGLRTTLRKQLLGHPRAMPGVWGRFALHRVLPREEFMGRCRRERTTNSLDLSSRASRGCGVGDPEDDGYLAHGTGLQGAVFLSLTPHLGALPPSHQDAPGKTLPTVNSNDPLKDVKWDDPVPLRGAELLNRSGTCCCGQIRARLRGQAQSWRQPCSRQSNFPA